MIKIGQVEKKVSNGKARVTALIEIDGGSYPLWYEVDVKYENALCVSRCDAFVVGLLLYAIRHGHDLSFETPLSKELKESIEEDFLLGAYDFEPGLNRIKLLGPTAEELIKDSVARGTGISCGVDSLHTVLRRIVSSAHSDEKNYLTIFNHHGAVGAPGTETAKSKARRFEYIVNRAQKFSEETGIPLIVLDTNYNSGEIPNLVSEGYSTFVNLFCAMALKGLFTHYFLASSGGVSEIDYYLRQGLLKADCDDYDLYTIHALSTRSLVLKVDGLVQRAEKTKFLLDKPLAHKFLDVCWRHDRDDLRNGTNDCPKCMRTVLELLSYGSGGLERFADVFDVPYVMAHKEEFLAEMIRGLLKRDRFMVRNWKFRRKMAFSVRDYLGALVIVMRKALHKMLRVGNVSYEFNARG